MRILERVERIPKELIEAYRQIAPATLGHMKNLRIMDSGIKPVYRRCKMVGPAFTVRAPGGLDSDILNKVNEMVRPGDVVVVDRGGDTEHAVIGEIRALRHLQMGVEGWVVDGAVCDAVAIEDMGFPTFSRTISALVAKRLGVQGDINVPVTCGRVVVNPGDLIVGDADGVVVLSREEAEELMPAMLEKEAKETEWRKEHAALLYRNRRQ